ncbi:cbb3-type cytochrome c oxidase subunit III [Cereibacter azotoformans]|uniref:Cbb3-type cytochrome c oxidase subunit III n=2 Tax=Cereibacter azotoformans TaxID=43057 RepID=A0A2T5KDL3_9RHOB|nr:cbb3-type cytochrome c oxidase subunit III [Cereibacter azotoformans]
MHLTGLKGMPRRVFTYPGHVGWDWLNLISTVGAFVMAAGFLVFVVDLLRPKRTKIGDRNPWGAGTLEWSLDLEDDNWGVRSIPHIETRYPLWQQPKLVERMDAGRFYLLGARHYDSACRVCHGAPGVTQGATVRAMLPAPPPIGDAVRDWRPNELGWIVREGVKMSGMPGWPSARNDEVWPVVAFLTRVRGMRPEHYAALVGPATAEGPPGFGSCAGCHGIDGLSGNERIPRLDIQTPDYLEMALLTYRDGRRQSGYMRHAASAVPAETLRPLAQRFGRLSDATARGAGQAARAAGSGAAGAAGASDDPVEEGRRLAFALDRRRDLPACHSCHGPDAERRRPDTPSLSGQYRGYLETQLILWRDGLRGGGPRAELMSEAARRLNDDHIAALAACYSSLAPEVPAAGGAAN